MHIAMYSLRLSFYMNIIFLHLQAIHIYIYVGGYDVCIYVCIDNIGAAFYPA